MWCTPNAQQQPTPPIDRLYNMELIWDRRALVTNESYGIPISTLVLWTAFSYAGGCGHHECLAGGAASGPSSARSTSVASAGAGAAAAASPANAGVTCDCIFLTASIFTLVDRFFCRVCSEVFDNLSLNALSAICLENK